MRFSDLIHIELWLFLSEQVFLGVILKFLTKYFNPFTLFNLLSSTPGFGQNVNNFPRAFAMASLQLICDEFISV